jgi:hypothetical protein
MAIFWPGAISHRMAFASSGAGLAGMLAALVFFPNIEPLFAGLLASATPIALKYVIARAQGNAD